MDKEDIEKIRLANSQYVHCQEHKGECSCYVEDESIKRAIFKHHRVAVDGYNPFKDKYLDAGDLAGKWLNADDLLKK